MINNQNTTNNKRLEQSLFLVPQKWQLDNVAKLDAEMAYVLNREAAQKSEAIAVESNSLVKSCKSPTSNFVELYEQNYQKTKAKLKERVFDKTLEKDNSFVSEKKTFERSLHTCPEPVSLERNKTISNVSYFDDIPKVGTISKDSKTCVRMFKQDWSGKFKLNLVTGALGVKANPPCISGDRISKELTQNSTRAILESGAFLSATRNGYTTFLTLTFDTDARRELEEIKPVNLNKSKKYFYHKRSLKTGKLLKAKTSYVVQCFSGVPNEFNPNLDEKITSYSNAVPATGSFTPITFEPKTTIGKEVSRFCDGVQKVYQRGWIAKKELIENKIKEYDWGKIECIENVEQSPAMPILCPEFVNPRKATGELSEFAKFDDLERYNNRKHTSYEYLEKEAFYGEQEKGAPLDYMWVAEQPENDKGEKNPHVHVLMRWQVEKPLFKAWANRLESLWGHGFAKLERIKTPEAASNYLLKAVGYLTKGDSSGQGEILGNRYSISASARAPKWECIGEFYADNFLAILGELREKLNRKKMRLSAKINAINNEQSSLIKDVKVKTNTAKKSKSKDQKAELERLIKEGEKAIAFNDHIIKNNLEQKNNLPYMNEYCLGGMNEEQASSFISWAMRERFWNAEVKENRYSQWLELKENTIQALKENRALWRGYDYLIQTSELTWGWASNDSNYELVTDKQNLIIDEDGKEWERVA